MLSVYAVLIAQERFSSNDMLQNCYIILCIYHHLAGMCAHFLHLSTSKLLSWTAAIVATAALRSSCWCQLSWWAWLPLLYINLKGTENPGNGAQSEKDKLGKLHENEPSDLRTHACRYLWYVIALFVCLFVSLSTTLFTVAPPLSISKQLTSKLLKLSRSIQTPYFSALWTFTTQ